jgi:prolipoprotein diacylglyceryltransferase
MSFPHGLIPTTLRVHPLPLYETAYALAIFLVLWPRGQPGIYARLPHGAILADVLLWTGICRFCTQFVSRNGKLFAGLTEAQLVSIAFAVGGLAIKIYLKRKSHASRPTATVLLAADLSRSPSDIRSRRQLQPGHCDDTEWQPRDSLGMLATPSATNGPEGLAPL